MEIDTTTMPVRILERVIGAPIELVWNAWTDPEHFVRWWGPGNTLNPPIQIDHRDGRTSIICTRSRDDGGCGESYSCAVCKKIVPLEHIQFTQRRSDKDWKIQVSIGNADHGVHAREVVLEIIFKSRGKWTELSIVELRDALVSDTSYSDEELHRSIDKLVDTLGHHSPLPIGRMSFKVMSLFWGGFLLVSSTLFWFIFFILFRQ